MRHMSTVLAWVGLGLLTAGPVVLAATSPLLAWRNLPYIIGGFAGIVGLALLVIQPVLAAGYLPGLRLARARRLHRWTGGALVACVVLHIAGLFVTSPPDTLDALLLVSPTPFSVYGVTAMWAVVLTALLVGFRRRLGIGFPAWRIVHNALALVIVVATVIHAVQIEGAMETVSKWVLCLAALAATIVALVDLRIVKPLLRWRARAS